MHYGLGTKYDLMTDGIDLPDIGSYFRRELDTGQASSAEVSIN
jgi:hypothetical protein